MERKKADTHIRLGNKEKAMAQKQAERLGLTLSAYIRMLIYEKKNEKTE